MQLQRIPSCSIFILVIDLVFEAASLPSPHSHKKVVVVEPNDEANTISKSEVGASWGGFSASAGLGGGSNGGGLHAEAGGPGLGAGAGISGTSYSASQAGAHAGASAGTGGYGVNYGGAGASAGAGAGAGAGTVGVEGGPQGGLFDNIFNIPISVLTAVNKYLNQKGPVNRPALRGRRRRLFGTVAAASGQHPGQLQPQGTHHTHETPSHQPALPPSVPAESHSSANAGATSHAGADAGVGAGAHASASASANAGSSAGAPSGGNGGSVTYVKKGPAHYDDVFNIPISALRSVNQLLNG